MVEVEAEAAMMVRNKMGSCLRICSKLGLGPSWIIGIVGIIYFQNLVLSPSQGGIMRYRSKRNLASSISSQPRLIGSIPKTSADQVVVIDSEGPMTLGAALGCCDVGGPALGKVFLALNLSISGECEPAAVRASISNGCPKFDANPAFTVVASATGDGISTFWTTGLYPPRDFLMEASVFSNSSIRLWSETTLPAGHTHLDPFCVSCWVRRGKCTPSSAPDTADKDRRRDCARI